MRYFSTAGTENYKGSNIEKKTGWEEEEEGKQKKKIGKYRSGKNMRCKKLICVISGKTKLIIIFPFLSVLDLVNLISEMSSSVRHEEKKMENAFLTVDRKETELRLS